MKIKWPTEKLGTEELARVLRMIAKALERGQTSGAYTTQEGYVVAWEV